MFDNFNHLICINDEIYEHIFSFETETGGLDQTHVHTYLFHSVAKKKNLFVFSPDLDFVSFIIMLECSNVNCSLVVQTNI